MPATQRRKIFPHLSETKTTSSDTGTKEKEDLYDNAKSKHPSARAKSNDKSNAKNKEANTTANINNSTNNSSSSRTNNNTSPQTPLLPLPLVLTTLLCSGIYWISSFRDMMATGKPVLDSLGMMLEGDVNWLVSVLFREMM